MKMVARVLVAAMAGLPLAAPSWVMAQAPKVESGIGTVTLMDPGLVQATTPSVATFRLDPARGEGKSVPLTVFMTPKLVKAAYVGVYVSAADQTLQAQLKLPEGVGLVVNSVEGKSPAESAGLQANDVITYFGDQMVINPDQFEVLVRTHKAGESVQVTVIREAQPLKVTVTLVEKEEPELSWMLASRRSAFGGPMSINSQVSVPNSGTLIIQNPDMKGDIGGGK